MNQNTKKFTDRLVNIHFQTGQLTIDWKLDNRMYMSGPVSNIQIVDINI